MKFAVAVRFSVKIDGIANDGDIINAYIGRTSIPLGGDNPITFGDRATGKAGAMEREQIQDMIAASEARSDAKFERLLGEVRVIGSEMRTEMAGLRGDLHAVQESTRGIKTTIVTSAIAVFFGLAALLLAVMTYGDAMFSRGMSVRDVVKAATEEQRKPAGPAAP